MGYLVCPSVKHSPQHNPTELSVYFPESNVSISKHITTSYFATMLVSDMAKNAILRFRADTGTFVDTFVKPGSGGLLRPWGLAFGPRESLFVASDGTGSILRYNSSTGG